MANLRLRGDHYKSENSRLRAKVKDLFEMQSIQVDEDLSSDLRAIVAEQPDENKSAFPPGTFLGLFWEQQKQALSLQDKRQMRWHPMIIKWCLSVKFCSSSAYSALRSTVLTLPSERTLRDYTHWIEAKPGMASDCDKLLLEEVQLHKKADYQRYNIIMHVYIKV